MPTRAVVRPRTLNASTRPATFKAPAPIRALSRVRTVGVVIPSFFADLSHGHAAVLDELADQFLVHVIKSIPGHGCNLPSFS